MHAERDRGISIHILDSRSQGPFQFFNQAVGRVLCNPQIGIELLSLEAETFRRRSGVFSCTVIHLDGIVDASSLTVDVSPCGIEHEPDCTRR